MAEIYTIATGTGNYTIIEYQRKSPNRKKFIPAGELINTDGYRVDGKAVYNARYIVTEEWENNTVVRRVYGTPPKGAYIPARLLQYVYDENADNIALASRKYPGKEFTNAIHGLLNSRAAEVLGTAYVPNGWRQSAWKGEGLVKTYCKPVLPPERVSIPIAIEYCGNNAEVFLDDGDPVAEFFCDIQDMGGKEDGRSVFTHLTHDLFQCEGCFRIKSDKGFIQYQEFRFMDQSRDDRNFLFHAMGIGRDGIR